jgi:hypothetical protein
MLSRSPLVHGRLRLRVSGPFPLMSQPAIVPFDLILRDQAFGRIIERVPARLPALEPGAHFLRLHGRPELR